MIQRGEGDKEVRDKDGGGIRIEEGWTIQTWRNELMRFLGIFCQRDLALTGSVTVTALFPAGVPVSTELFVEGDREQDGGFLFTSTSAAAPTSETKLHLSSSRSENDRESLDSMIPSQFIDRLYLLLKARD